MTTNANNNNVTIRARWSNTQSKPKFLCMLLINDIYSCELFANGRDDEIENTISEADNIEYHIWSTTPMDKEEFIERMDFENKYLNNFGEDDV